MKRRRKDDPDGSVETLIVRTVRQGPLAGQNYIYRDVFWRLDDFITQDWQTLFDMAALLAKTYSASGVRFVVWFI